MRDFHQPGAIGGHFIWRDKGRPAPAVLIAPEPSGGRISPGTNLANSGLNDRARAAEALARLW